MKKIEKNITYDENTDTYLVNFRLEKKETTRNFPTLQDAITYRDTINAEKLKFKIKRDIEAIRNQEKQYMVTHNETYPENLYELCVTDYHDYEDVLEHFDEILALRLTDRERQFIKWYFEDMHTFSEVANLSDPKITMERARQIVSKAMRKIKWSIMAYRKHKLIEEQKQERIKENELRLQILEDFKATHNLTNEVLGIIDNPILDKLYIDELDLSVRSYNCLRRANIKTLEDIMQLVLEGHFEKRISKIRNMGRKSVREIIERIHVYGDKYHIVEFQNL